MRMPNYKKIFFLLMATCTHLNASTDPLTDIAQKLVAALDSLSSITTGDIALSLELVTGPTYELLSTILPRLSDSEIATLCRYISTEYAPKTITAAASSSNQLTQELQNIENTLKTLRTHATNATTYALAQEQLPATLLVIGTFLAHIAYNTNMSNATQRNNCAKHLIRLINLLDFIVSDWNIPIGVGSLSLNSKQSKVHTSLKNNNTVSSTWFVTSSSKSGNWTYVNGRATTTWLKSITQLTLNYCAAIMVAKSLKTQPTSKTKNRGITTDKDGRIFYCNADEYAIHRINNNNSLTSFNTTYQGVDAVCTEDNSIWFTQKGPKIGKITSNGTLTEYTLDIFGGSGITVGPDNNLWFCDQTTNKIGKITQSGVSTLYLASSRYKGPMGITTGPDGNLWFTGFADDSINVMNTNGEIIASYPTNNALTGSSPRDICLGADGNIWYTSDNGIHKITPNGVITNYTQQQFQLPEGLFIPRSITLGWDGNIWFAGETPTTFGRLTPLGIITLFIQPQFNSYAITQGPNNKLWLTSSTTKEINSLQI